MDTSQLQKELNRIGWDGVLYLETSSGVVYIPITSFDNIESVVNRITNYRRS